MLSATDNIHKFTSPSGLTAFLLVSLKRIENYQRFMSVAGLVRVGKFFRAFGWAWLGASHAARAVCATSRSIVSAGYVVGNVLRYLVTFSHWDNWPDGSGPSVILCGQWCYRVQKITWVNVPSLMLMIRFAACSGV